MKILSTIRSIIKSAPGLHRALSPAVHLVRRARYLLTRSGEQRFRDCCSALSAVLPEAYFINVGANDGITGTPAIKILLGNRNWKGLLIEPVPYCFERLKANFPDKDRFQLAQVAIGSPAGCRRFYYVDPCVNVRIHNLPEWFDQLGSFNREHIMKHLDAAIEPFIKEIQIEVCTLTEIIRRNNIPQIHLLHVDTEGSDWEVIRSLDFSAYHPVMIFVEHAHLHLRDKREMKKMLKNQGYSLFNCGKDYFALNQRLFAQCTHRSNA